MTESDSDKYGRPIQQNSIKAAKSIDLHAHAVLDQSIGAAGEHGPELIETASPLIVSSWCI